TTGDDGKFNVDDESAQVLTVTRPDYAGAEVAIQDPKSNIEILLRPTTISGTVKNSRSGDPMAGVIVVLTRADGQTVAATTDAEGKYLLADVSEGDTLTVQVEGATV